MPPVHTLVCEAHVPFAVPCLQSFLRHSADPVRLIIHCDGSLLPASVERLLAALPGATLIDRPTADAALAEPLARFPFLAKARRRLPHILKLFDIHFLGQPGPVTRFLDSDIFFFRPFRGLFPAGPGCPAAFSADSQNSFAARCSDFWPLGPLVLGRRVNSGLFSTQIRLLDLDRFDWLCRRWGPRRIDAYGGWFEQTLWADLAWRVRARLIHPDDVRTATPDGPAPRAEVAIHFVTPARAQLFDLLANRAPAPHHAYRDPADPKPVAIRTIPISPYNLVDSLVAAARLRLRPRLRNPSRSAPQPSLLKSPISNLKLR